VAAAAARKKPRPLRTAVLVIPYTLIGAESQGCAVFRRSLAVCWRGIFI
jgi:hypothetical protein